MSPFFRPKRKYTHESLNHNLVEQMYQSRLAHFIQLTIFIRALNSE